MNQTEGKALRPLWDLSGCEGIRTRTKMRSIQVKRMVPVAEYQPQGAKYGAVVLFPVPGTKYEHHGWK